MFASKALRQAAVHAERQPMIRFIGPRTVPGLKQLANVDHSPHPHPASPTGALPKDFASSHAAAASASKHATFSTYRDHAQQFGPLQKTILPMSEKGIGGTAGAELGSVKAPKGQYFDRGELPARFFRKVPVGLAEIEAIESGGAALLN